MSKFQIVVLAIFAVAIVGSVAAFSLYRGSGSVTVSVSIWGDISSQNFNLLLSNTSLSQDRSFIISYEEKSKETIDAEFTEALARGAGPDLIVITQDQYWKNRAKLIAVPYETMSEGDFKTTFIEEAELFLDQSGVYALPLSIDPMVLYYNRDLLSSAGYAEPIRYWDQIFAAASNLSKLDPAGNLVGSVMALGEAHNIPHAKDILSLLMLQAGTPITAFVSGELRPQIGNSFNLPITPGESALDFYTQFSNPAKVYYSWNRSLIDAQTHFTSGDSAYYLGFASELGVLRNKNPNLNFGVAAVPQSRVSNKVVTFGRLKGLAISRGSRNPSAAFVVATRLVSSESLGVLSQLTFLPPTRRDLLSSRQTDAILSVFYDAALQSKAWIDPDREATKSIFDDTIESVTSGRSRTFEAVTKMDEEMGNLIN